MSVVRRCTCGHAEGEHRSSGSRFPHPLRFGVCLVPDCGCAMFVPADDEQARAEKWLSRIDPSDFAC